MAERFLDKPTLRLSLLVETGPLNEKFLQKTYKVVLSKMDCGRQKTYMVSMVKLEF